MYGHVDGSVLLSFSCSGFACVLQLCAEMSGFCDCRGPVASLRSGKRLESPPHEQQPRTSHLGADAGPCITEC
jgi:hypothetical protein